MVSGQPTVSSTGRRLIVRVLALLVVLSTVGALVWLFLDRSHIVGRTAIYVQRTDIVRLQLIPIPEGPAGPLFERPLKHDYALPLGLIEDQIPIPLPEPLWQGFSCGGGGDLEIELAGGRTIVYGPCRRPAAIEKLWDDAERVSELARASG